MHVVATEGDEGGAARIADCVLYVPPCKGLVLRHHGERPLQLPSHAMSPSNAAADVDHPRNPREVS